MVFPFGALAPDGRERGHQWHRSIQSIVLEIDKNIKEQNDEALTLSNLARFLGYSECYVSRKFSEISGVQLRDYLRYRKLAFAHKYIRDTEEGILDIVQTSRKK